jgi:hypothetical protein
VGKTLQTLTKGGFQGRKKKMDLILLSEVKVVRKNSESSDAFRKNNYKED